MPLDDGCRFDEHHGVEDLRPDLVKPHPEQPVGGEEPRLARALPTQDGRGMSCLYKYSKDANEEALELLRKAGNLDANFALSFAQASWSYSQRLTFGWAKDRAHEAIEAERLARRALELDRNDPRVLATVGWVLVYVVGHIREGAGFVDQALDLDPNFAVGWTWRGFAKLWLGVGNSLEDFRACFAPQPGRPENFYCTVRNGVCPLFRGPIRRCIVVGCKSAWAAA
jgi:tetratricopeptide (TPR) repeat protein